MTITINYWCVFSLKYLELLCRMCGILRIKYESKLFCEQKREMRFACTMTNDWNSSEKPQHPFHSLNTYSAYQFFFKADSWAEMQSISFRECTVVVRKQTVDLRYYRNYIRQSIKIAWLKIASLPATTMIAMTMMMEKTHWSNSNHENALDVLSTTWKSLTIAVYVASQINFISWIWLKINPM